MSNVFGNFGTLFYFVHFWETVAKQVKSRISGWEVDHSWSNPIFSLCDPFRLRIPHWSPHFPPQVFQVPGLRLGAGLRPVSTRRSRCRSRRRRSRWGRGSWKLERRTLEDVAQRVDVNSCSRLAMLNSSVNFFWNLPSSKFWSSFVLETNSFLGSAGDGTLFLPETSTAGVRSCCRASGVPWRRHVLRRFSACWINDSTYKRYETLSNDIINNIIL